MIDTGKPEDTELVEVVWGKRVTVKAVVSGKDVVERPVAYGREVVLVKPTGEPKLEFDDGVAELIDAEVPVRRLTVVYEVLVAKLLG